MISSTTAFLRGESPRARWMRLQTASILKRFFFCERSLIISQAAWLASIAPLEVKTTLPRFIWQQAMTAQALRERVFELRYPSRLMEVGQDTPLIQVFDEALHAPSAEAFVFSLADVFAPALASAYRAYLEAADEIADGPTLRFLHTAIEELDERIPALRQSAGEMFAAAPTRRAEAVAWANTLRTALASVGGVGLEEPKPLPASLDWPGRRVFQFSEIPARDARFHLCRFYWPDILDPGFPYGEGLLLQLRSAVSHLNEVWAVETGGAILYFFAEPLGWEFIFEAARWTYDESRHCRMGWERLRDWGFEPREIPLGTYIYDSARGQSPLYRLGMLSYFETKNIGKKRQRAETFAQYHDQVSQHDMEFDWADETIHAHYGSHWLGELHRLQPETVPPPETIRSRCDELVSAVVQSATADERADIYAVAQALSAKAEQLAQVSRG